VDNKPAVQNVQDAFLNTARREKDTVTVHLMNGAKLTGRIKSFDKFSVLVESGSQEHLVFKHAISNIVHVRRGQSETRPQQSAQQTGAPPTSPPTSPPESAGE
jgi:host factor-I protein